MQRYVLYYVLPRHSLLIICKSFIRPHLDYDDISYDQPNNQAIRSKLEAIQQNAALAITGAIQDTSRINVYHELRIEPLKSCRWFRHLCYFYKITIYGLPGYLFKLILLDTHSCSTFFFSHGQLLNGTNLIYDVTKLLMCLETICLGVSNPCQNTYIIFIVPQECDFLPEWDLGSVI